MIYFIQAGKEGPIKIGYSATPHKRRITLQAAWYEELHLLAVTEGTLMTERDFHVRFEDAHINGEWFHPVQRLLSYIRSLPPHPAYYLYKKHCRVKKRTPESRACVERLAQGNANCRAILECLNEGRLADLAGYGWEEGRLARPRPSPRGRKEKMTELALLRCRQWRALLQMADEPPFRAQLKRRQRHLAEIRKWRRTGIEPRGIPGGLRILKERRKEPRYGPPVDPSTHRENVARIRQELYGDCT